MARHEYALCTPATAALYQLRYGPRATRHLPYGERLEWGGLQLTTYPAGHCLGSAMLLAEDGEQSLLYTGDFKLGESATAERAEAAAGRHPRHREHLRPADVPPPAARAGARPIVHAGAPGNRPRLHAGRRSLHHGQGPGSHAAADRGRLSRAATSENLRRSARCIGSAESIWAIAIAMPEPRTQATSSSCHRGCTAPAACRA